MQCMTNCPTYIFNYCVKKENSENECFRFTRLFVERIGHFWFLIRKKTFNSEFFKKKNHILKKNPNQRKVPWCTCMGTADTCCGCQLDCCSLVEHMAGDGNNGVPQCSSWRPLWLADLHLNSLYIDSQNRTMRRSHWASQSERVLFGWKTNGQRR